MTTFLQRVQYGVRAFREAWMSADILTDENDFNSFDARKLRYALYWSYYENTAYANIHQWARLYKANYGMYKAVRGIYNPAYRLGEFWKTHLWGGSLNNEAGNGQESAIPIETDNENLRDAIAQVWAWSNWQLNKNVCALWGTVLGDVGIKVIDNVEKGKVYLQVVHPGTIKDITLDKLGNVKGYVIEEERLDPDNSNRTVVYREVATRDGENVCYQLFRNDALYSWGGDVAEWAEPYGFIPMVFIRHNNVGLTYGWSEYQACHAKFREVDDISSKLSDQIRKMVDAPWLFSGVNKPQRKATVTGSFPTEEDPQPVREEIPVFYGPSGSSATPPVSNLSISDTASYIKDLLGILEKDYPELNTDLLNVKGDISGRALRVNQRPSENKVRDRRVNYDDALIRAQQMAVAIGGYRHYDGFAGFDLDSYYAGDLNHAVADRPVYQEDKADELDYEQTFWTVAKVAKDNGIPLPVFLKKHGWSEEAIDEVVNSEEYKAKLLALKQLASLSDGLGEGSNGGDPEGEQVVETGIGTEPDANQNQE
jgi:hypothetical protein